MRHELFGRFDFRGLTPLLQLSPERPPAPQLPATALAVPRLRTRLRRPLVFRVLHLDAEPLPDEPSQEP